jgi:hypothetical protein
VRTVQHYVTSVRATSADSNIQSLTSCKRRVVLFLVYYAMLPSCEDAGADRLKLRKINVTHMFFGAVISCAAPLSCGDEFGAKCMVGD